MTVGSLRLLVSKGARACSRSAEGPIASKGLVTVGSLRLLVSKGARACSRSAEGPNATRPSLSRYTRAARRSASWPLDSSTPSRSRSMKDRSSSLARAAAASANRGE
eukprot:1115530-Pyramimonas_sp.AAC.1